MRTSERDLALPRRSVLPRIVNTWLLVVLAYLTLLGGTIPGSFDFTLTIVTHSLAFATILGWLVWKTVARESLPRTALDRPIAVFICLAVLSAITGVQPRLALENVVRMLGYAATYYMTVDLIRSRGSGAVAARIVLAIATVVMFAGLIEWIVWFVDQCKSAGAYPPWLASDWPAMLVPPFGHRLSLTLTNPNILAAYLVLVLPLGIVNCLTAGTHRLAWLVWLMAGLIVAAMAASRGGLIGLAVALSVFLLVTAGQGVRIAARAAPMAMKCTHALQSLGFRRWRTRHSLRKPGSKVPLAQTVLASAAIAMIATLATSGLLMAGQSTDRATSAGVRVPYWNAAIQMLVERPVLGGGAGTFPYRYSAFHQAEPGNLTQTQNNTPAHSHNLILDTGADLGILGLMAGFWLVATAGLSAVKAYRVAPTRSQRTLVAASAAGLCGILVHCLVDDPLVWPTVGLTAAVLLAVAVSSVSPTTTERHRVNAVSGGAIASWRVHAICLATMAMIGILLFRIDVAHSYYSSAVAAANQGRWPDAIQALTRAINWDIQLEFYQLQLLTARMQLPGGADEARRLADDYQGHVYRYANYAFAHANLGFLFLEAGEHDRAVDELRKAIALAPSEPAYPLNLESILSRSDRTAQPGSDYISAFAKDTPLAACQSRRSGPLPNMDESSIDGQEERAVAEEAMPSAKQRCSNVSQLGRMVFHREDFATSLHPGICVP